MELWGKGFERATAHKFIYSKEKYNKNFDFQMHYVLDYV